MLISIIAAIGKNRELGKNNQLLWHIPEDLKRFKKLTERHAVIMGRKTFQSIGKPLPNRLNVIITRQDNFLEKAQYRVSSFNRNTPSPCQRRGRLLEKVWKQISSSSLMTVSSIQEALNLIRNPQSIIDRSINRDEVFVIGGGQIYHQAIKYADKLYLTVVEKEFPQADTFFPDYSFFKKVVYKQKGQFKNLQFTFLELER